MDSNNPPAPSTPVEQPRVPEPCPPHDWKYEDDEYGSLASGGSYAVYRCTKCGGVDYAQLPD